MKKIMPNVAAVGLALFALAVFTIVISLSYKALGLIFPNDLFDQAIGLVLFDASALLWFAVFVYLSRSTAQYVFSFFGFLIGLGGTIGLVGIEVGLSSGMLELEMMRKPLVYIFIGVAVSHLILLYARHASSPEVNNEISMGVDLAKVEDEGQKQAEAHIKKAMPQLGAVIASRLIEDAMQRLNIRPQIIDAKALPVYDDLNTSTNGYPAQAENAAPAADKRNALREWFHFKIKGLGKRQYEQVVRTPVQQAGNVDRQDSPTAQTFTPAPRPDYEQVGALHHEVVHEKEPLYHPDLYMPVRKVHEEKREEEPALFRSDPIIFTSKIERYFDDKAVWIGKPIMAIQCEDGLWNLSDEESSSAFARVSEDELNTLRFKPAEEATQTGADFRKD